MLIYKNIHELQKIKKSVITIGSFDGVHLGHQKILKQVDNLANEHHLESIVITFQKHPRLILENENALSVITTLQEKCNLFEKNNIQHCITLAFDKTLSEMSAESFIKDFLVYYFNPSFIVVGYDHHFGKNKSGNINTLKHYAATYSYKVDEISIQAIDELKISSTLIRQAIQTGEIDKANMLLGYAYFLQGTIIKGKQLGRTIGFPTANIALPKENKILPPKGVYVVTFIINGEETTYKGMLNIGVNPTVENTQDIKIEVHIFDFNKEIYGREVTISFKQKIRDEIKFADINALKAQLEEDKYVAISLN